MKVLIADDHRLIAEGIRRALDDTDDFEVVGEANTGSQVMPLVRRTTPDLVLLDLRMPGMDGLACLEQIREQHPEIKVVILSASTDPNLIQTALKRGASAFVDQEREPRRPSVGAPSGDRGDRLLGHRPGCRRRGRGNPGVRAHRARADDPARTLTRPRNQAIAKELWLAEQTVKFHLTNIYRKLGVGNRTEAVRLAYQHGLIENPLYDGQ